MVQVARNLTTEGWGVSRVAGLVSTTRATGMRSDGTYELPPE